MASIKNLGFPTTMEGLRVAEMIKNLLSGIPPSLWMGIGLLILLKFLMPAWLPKIKGRLGEMSVARGLRRLDTRFYHTIHDLYLPRPDGQGTTQVDHVVVSPYGVFVIETKNYKGWIFGSEKQNQWTQSIYRRKHRFQNPLHQNRLHVQALESFLGLDQNQFHPVVYFTGGSTFKTEMPGNVMDRGLLRYIAGFDAPILDDNIVTQCLDKLRRFDATQERKTIARNHAKALRARIDR